MDFKPMFDYLEKKTHPKKIGAPILLGAVALAVILGLLANRALDRIAPLPTATINAEVKAAAEAPSMVNPTKEPSMQSEEHPQYGTRENINGISVVNLYGTWQEMGLRYGELFAPELKEILEEKILPQTQVNPEQQEEMKKTAQAVYRNYPARLKQFFRGMAEGAQISEDRLILVNAVETIFTIEQTQEPGCAGIAVWDEYANGELVYGRNYDYGPLFKAFAKDVAVTIYHPADGSAATATVGYIGEIYCTTGMNANGIFLALNNGTPSSHEKAPERLSSIAQLLSLLFDAESLDYVDSFFRTVQSEYAYLIGAADAREARSYEWCPQGVKRGDSTTPKGLMVMTNHYVNEDWDFATPTDEQSWNSLTRRENLLKLAEQNKGSINAQKMTELMETSLEQGGATSDSTVYQVIAVPEDYSLTIRVIGGTDWTTIDLRPYFLAESRVK